MGLHLVLLLLTLKGQIEVIDAIWTFISVMVCPRPMVTIEHE